MVPCISTGAGVCGGGAETPSGGAAHEYVVRDGRRGLDGRQGRDGRRHGGRAGHLEAVGGDLRPGGALDRGGQLRGLGVAVVRVLGRRARDHLVEGLGQVGALQTRRGRRVGDVRPQLRHVVVLREGDAAGEHLVEHAAERVDVRAPVDGAGLDLLGRHVVGGADPGARAGQTAGRAEALGQPEVGEVDVLVLALAADQDVGRLDVAVHQPALVRGVERRADRGGDARDPRQGRSCPWSTTWRRLVPGTKRIAR